MCKQVYYFCHCCKIRAIDANNWKCFYNYEDYRFFERVYDPSHLLKIVYIQCTFGMCGFCKLACKEVCNKEIFEEKDFDVERSTFKPPYLVQNKITFKEFFNICLFKIFDSNKKV